MKFGVCITLKRFHQKKSANQQCRFCKEAVISSKIFCERLGEYVENLVYCPYFREKSEVKLQTVT